MSVFRVRFLVRGGHVHCSLFAAKIHGQTYAKCGDFTVQRGEEFSSLVSAFDGVEFLGNEKNIGILEASRS